MPGRQREFGSSREKREQGSGLFFFFFYWGGGWGPRFSWTHYLSVNLKQKSHKLRPGKSEKSKWPKWSVIKIKIPKTKVGEAAWLFI